MNFAPGFSFWVAFQSELLNDWPCAKTHTCHLHDSGTKLLGVNKTGLTRRRSTSVFLPVMPVGRVLFVSTADQLMPALLLLTNMPYLKTKPPCQLRLACLFITAPGTHQLIPTTRKKKSLRL